MRKCAHRVSRAATIQPRTKAYVGCVPKEQRGSSSKWDWLQNDIRQTSGVISYFEPLEVAKRGLGPQELLGDVLCRFPLI